jgi:hypothetical protein
MSSYTGHSRLMAGRLFLLLVIAFVFMLPMASLGDGNGDPPIQGPDPGDPVFPPPGDSIDYAGYTAALLLELAQLATP